MAKKLIDVVREHFKLKPYEEFFIKGKDESTRYRFTKTTLEFFDNHFQNIWVKCKATVLGELILGDFGIVTPPFQPNIGETYWTYADNWDVKEKVWCASYDDQCNKKIGCVFRGRSEAVSSFAEKYEEIMGQKPEDNAFEDVMR